MPGTAGSVRPGWTFRGGTIHAITGGKSGGRVGGHPPPRSSAWRMKTSAQLTKIERYQNLGFLGILIPCFLDDLHQLQVLGHSDHPLSFLYCRSTLDLLLVLAVWWWVNRSSRRILARVQYLEKFMRVCAWCRRIHHQGEWMPLEEFLRQSFDTPTTHGICKDCLAQQHAAIDRAKQARPSTTPES